MGDTEKIKDDNKKKSRGKEFWGKLAFKICFVLISVAVLVVAAYVVYDKFFVDRGHETTTISESTLEEIIQIEELSTVDYTYNSILAVYTTDGKTVKYYVSYEGVVKAGVDFGKVDIKKDEENKKINVSIPDVEIQQMTVDIGSLDFIFTKDKYETETVVQEAYKLCELDLAGKIGKENALYTMAEENARVTIEALIKPLIEQVEGSGLYTIEIK